MTAERRAHIAALFDEAIASPREMRDGIVARVASDDLELGEELRSLLSASDAAEKYFEVAEEAIGPALGELALAGDDLLADELRSRLERALETTYRIERELGGGGMSRVFLATEVRLDRKVVIKILPEEMALGVSFERFRREIQLSARLQHPHIVPVLTTDVADGLMYYAMPYVAGETLRSRIARDGPLPLADAIAIWRDMLEALAYAHASGVVHRDIKPENVLLGNRHALVADFGIARAIEAAADEANVTATGVTLGTPAYMAPEQAAGEGAVDHRIDIYAAGLVMYEMLAGRAPFAGLGARQVLVAHITQEPAALTRPDLPARLGALVLRCLAKDPDARPPTAESILDEVERGVEGPAARRRPTRAMWAAGGAAVILLVLLAALGGFLYKRPAGTSGTTGGNELTSVAVLPLFNVGGDTASEYFSDGMTDELANALGKLPGLHVVSRTSAYTFKGRRNAGAAEVGRELHVQAFIGGTVRRAGDRLRVTAQLTNVSDGLELWSETYERPATDVFKVQDDIAQSITDALRRKLGARAENPSSTESAASRGTDNLAAYDAYLRGIYLWNRRDAENLTRAISQFERAVAIDPRFARAYAAMASVHALLPEYTDSPPPNSQRHARAAASRALAIDSTLAEAHTALGLVAMHDWDYPAAEKQYLMAIAREPEYATAHQWYGEYLLRTGRVDTATAEIRRALALDPLAPILETVLAFALQAAGRYDEAAAAAKRGIELAPTAGVIHTMLGRSYLNKGEYAKGLREMELSARLDPTISSRQGELAWAYGFSGDTIRARAVLAKLIERAKSESISPIAFALAYIGLGETDAALSALERAVDQHDIALVNMSLMAQPTFNPLRGQPRFTRILERQNLGPYIRGANLPGTPPKTAATIQRK